MDGRNVEAEGVVAEETWSRTSGQIPSRGRSVGRTDEQEWSSPEAGLLWWMWAEMKAGRLWRSGRRPKSKGPVGGVSVEKVSAGSVGWSVVAVWEEAFVSAGMAE